MFYDTYVAICAQKGVSPSRAAEEAGISKSLVTKWKNNKVVLPSPDILKKLSVYFGIPVSDLIAESETPAAQEGNGDDPVTMELLSMVNNATDDERQVMLEMLRLLKKQRKE